MTLSYRWHCQNGRVSVCTCVCSSETLEHMFKSASTFKPGKICAISFSEWAKQHSEHNFWIELLCRHSAKKNQYLVTRAHTQYITYHSFIQSDIKIVWKSQHRSQKETKIHWNRVIIACPYSEQKRINIYIYYRKMKICAY